MGAAVYRGGEGNTQWIDLSLVGTPPAGWSITLEDGTSVYDESVWRAAGSLHAFAVAVPGERVPSGLEVRWAEAKGSAWWPVNVLDGDRLPPPDELRDLPLDVLIRVLTSAYPLHLALRPWINRKPKHGGNANNAPVVDPHQRVDVTAFLLQRTRRISAALNALGEQLARPVATEQSLQWRLRGPVGVHAVVNAIIKEAASPEERSFLLSDIALELSRIKPAPAPGCLPPADVKTQIDQYVRELEPRAKQAPADAIPNLADYVDRVFKEVHP